MKTPFVWLSNSGSENEGTQFGKIIFWKLYKCAVTYWMPSSLHAWCVRFLNFLLDEKKNPNNPKKKSKKIPKLYKRAVTYWMLAAFKPLACMLGVSVFETSSLMKSFDDASFGCLDVPWYNNDLAIAHQFSLNGIYLLLKVVIKVAIHYLFIVL